MTAQILILVCIWSISIMLIIETEGLFVPKRVVPFNTREKVIMDPKKRPFCNAFTGCGRKRSNLPALTSNGEEMEDSLNSLLELSEEPAIDDLSRQIMSEAKLWEAIQEANVELNRHKQQQSLINPDDGVRSASANCVLPPCYI
ncbi:crustacean cardioactive peptide [Rhynchophorus ferrugineus]|uniref:crustacean cardioactive peptide n=1 Tax=Rhynchophorus ferrugineus TaxID=354439 RepID=UPI003FCC4817